MDDHLGAVTEVKKGLLLLAELAQHAAMVGGMGNSYAEKCIQRNTRNWHSMGHQVYVNTQVFLQDVSDEP